MADYIDQEALMQKIEELRKSHKLKTDEEMMFDETDIAGLLSCIPTTDVAPVRHGRLLRTRFDECYCEWGECSVCGWDNPINARYCNGCGAKMDGGDEHEAG